MPTYKELYSWPSINETYELYGVAERGFEQELSYGDFSANNRVVVKTLTNKNFDGERGWSVETIWFDGKPFMVLCSAGRGNRDFRERYITDADVFNAAVSYMREISDQRDIVDVEDPDDQADVTFYGYTLSDFYNPAGVNPSYVIGDVVYAEVKENHLRDRYARNPKMIKTRVLITVVRPLSPDNTYSGVQIDRRWGEGEDHNKMIDAPGKGVIYANFSEEVVVGHARLDPPHKLFAEFRKADEKAPAGSK